MVSLSDADKEAMRVIAIVVLASSLSLAGCGFGPFANQPETETPPPVVAVQPTPVDDRPSIETPETSAAEIAAIEEAELASEVLPNYGENEYGLTLSRKLVEQEWVEKIRSGEKTLEGAKVEIGEIASERYPAFASDIAAGQTLKQAVQPYSVFGADMLELFDPLPLDDPVIIAVLNYRDESGQYSKMPVYTFEQVLGQDPRYRLTRDFRERQAEAIGGLLGW